MRSGRVGERVFSSPTAAWGSMTTPEPGLGAWPGSAMSPLPSTTTGRDGRRPNQEAFARLGELMGDPLRIRAIGQAGLDVLLAQEQTDQGRVAAIGYCFGGTMALELARGGADLGAVVGFHSGLATTRPDDAKQIRGTILVCLGADDPLVPADQRRAFEEEMRAAGVDWRMNLYGGAVHSFTDERAGQSGIEGLAYHRPTDERSWRAMLDLFEERFADSRG